MMKYFNLLIKLLGLSPLLIANIAMASLWDEMVPLQPLCEESVFKSSNQSLCEESKKSNINVALVIACLHPQFGGHPEICPPEELNLFDLPELPYSQKGYPTWNQFYTPLDTILSGAAIRASDNVAMESAFDSILYDQSYIEDLCINEEGFASTDRLLCAKYIDDLGLVAPYKPTITIKAEVFFEEGSFEISGDQREQLKARIDQQLTDFVTQLKQQFGISEVRHRKFKSKKFVIKGYASKVALENDFSRIDHERADHLGIYIIYGIIRKFDVDTGRIRSNSIGYEIIERSHKDAKCMPLEDNPMLPNNCDPSLDRRAELELELYYDEEL